ncbi:MAG: ATP-dependent DNA helicase RecG [Candidatus Competibacteraceae bacterium]
MSAVSETSVRLALQDLKGVGPRLLERLQRLGITAVEQLLFHLPLRYQDRTRITPIGGLQVGVEAVVEAEVVLTEVSQRGRRALLCLLQDGTGSLTLRFFHFSTAQYKLLAQPGIRLRCYGEVRGGAGMLEMIHPEYWRLDGESPPLLDDHLTPVYPTTEGLHQLTLRSLLRQALWRLEEDPDCLPECLPATLRERLNFPTLAEAVRWLHCPPAAWSPLELETQLRLARQRLAFEELLAHHLSLRQLRQQIQRNTALALTDGDELRRQFLQGLPFTLTAAQQRVMGEIDADLMQPRPMLRLLQGDVGSGKTVVAAAAALRAVAMGCQAAVMAPTELLAEQHYRSFSNWLLPLGLEVAWLTGRLKGKAREAMLAQIRSGEAAVIVGTHALFQEDVVFAGLTLVVIDEQHRFGVHQRLALREKGRQGGYCPHQLIMTATPIPRTLAMSAYADLDTSIIDEKPPGRIDVQTAVIAESRRAEVIERIRLACEQGRQAYWVCPLIEESELLECQAAADTARYLSQALPGLRVGLVHGRLKSAEKEQVMAAFKAGELNLLVATTVIEVGVDVPNASLMIVENAERLGLAQLHQLRGRIGRGSTQSSCVLLYRGPLSEQAHGRLAILRASNDGFEIAERDLRLRGPGEVLGTRQTGDLTLRVADLMRDQDLLEWVQPTAGELLQRYPHQTQALIRRWIGEGERYGEV